VSQSTTALDAKTGVGSDMPAERVGPGVIRRLAGHPGTLLALAYLLVLVVASLAAPLVAPHSPLDQDLAHALAGPGKHHWLGTDTLGRDVLSRLIYGARPVLTGVAVALLTALVLSVPSGLAAGYLGGWVDATVGRIADVALAVPAIILVLVVLSVFSGDQTAAMIALGVLVSPGLMRVVRSQTLAVRRELFVDAAVVSGLKNSQIIRRHVLPRVLGPLIIQATLIIAGAVITVASLGFLGLGPPPPNPSWGQMVAEAATQIQNDFWLVVPSGVAVSLTCLCLGVVGGTLRTTATAAWSRPKTVVKPVSDRNQRPEAAPALGGLRPDALLTVRGLSVSLAGPDGEVSLLDDISFDVRPGETVGVVGESGCGKTLTSLAILGMLPPGARVVSGQFVFAGNDLTYASPKQWRGVRGRKIAMISQSPMVALDPAFTVRSQVSEAVRTHERCSRRAARRRVGQLLEMVGLPDPDAVGRKYPHELSGGMAQRVCIAIALAGDPKLLVADEPTTALDVTAQAAILDLLRTLQRDRGLAVLLITHDWGVVADLCERAVVMYAGQVVEYADVATVIGGPLHPYSQGLLRSNPANASPRATLPIIRGTVPQPRERMAGCRFAPRCDYATTKCVGDVIALTEQRSEHFSRCVEVDALASLSSRE
jgi:peptide/nickel transport system permease protein